MQSEQSSCLPSKSPGDTVQLINYSYATLFKTACHINCVPSTSMAVHGGFSLAYKKKNPFFSLPSVKRIQCSRTLSAVVLAWSIQHSLTPNTSLIYGVTVSMEHPRFCCFSTLQREIEKLLFVELVLKLKFKNSSWSLCRDKDAALSGVALGIFSGKEP